MTAGALVIRTSPGALAVLALMTLGPSLRGQATPTTRSDIPFSTEIVTPHVPWATKLPGGPVRGAFRPEYAHVTVADGSTAGFVLPSALNDAQGEYRIRVTDVLSGASAERRLRLE